MLGIVVCADGTSLHTGSTVVGPVAGTLTPGSNSFVTINGTLIMVENGQMVIPTHMYNLIPPLFHSHSFPPVASQGYVTIAGTKMVLLGDAGADGTSIDGAGSNGFVTIS